VKDGECYALVWTKTGAAFAGISADGTAVGADSKVLVFAPVAKGGKCPTVVFELDAALAKSYANGSYGIYLCDTRLASGVVGGINAEGLPVAVNAFGAVKGEGQGQEKNGSNAFVNLPPADSTLVSVTTKSAIPDNAPQPQITSIKVVGANIVLTVKGTLPCLQYAAEEVKVGGQESNDSTSQTSIQGAATADEEITVIIPKKGDRGFFKVGRK